MNTAKAHTHITMQCELTAVFLYTISVGYLGEVQKAVALSTIFRGAKIMEIFHASKTFAIYLTDSYHFQGLKGLTSLLFCANSLIIQKLFVNLQPKPNKD